MLRADCRGLLHHRITLAILITACLVLGLAPRLSAVVRGGPLASTSVVGPALLTQTSNGTLSATNATDVAQVNLTTEGTDDWAHWGQFTAASFDRKAGVPQQIPQFTLPTGGTAARFTPFPTTFSWTDSTPTTSLSTPSGDYLTGAGHSFQLVLPADNSATRTLKLHVGFYRVLGQLSASLSDGSAPPVSVSVDNTAGRTSMRVLSVDYRATSQGQTLTVSVNIQTDHGSGTMSLEATSLSSVLQPTATPTSTTTPGVTNSATVTDTPTNTSTSTANDTPTATVTVSATPAASDTSTNTATTTPAATTTPTTTTTPTSIASASPTATTTPTVTPSATATFAAGTIPVGDPGVFWAPYAWNLNGGTWAQATNMGAYALVGFQGTSFAVNVDVSPLLPLGSPQPTIPRFPS